jgi:hypothetical protein
MVQARRRESMANHPRINSYESAKNYIYEGRNKKQRRRIDKSTLVFYSGDDIIIKYHNTDIIVYHADCTHITVNFNGWHTITTRKRFNEYTPLGCCSAGRGKSIMQYYGQEIPVFNTAKINLHDGTYVTDYVESDEAKNKAMLKKIKAYAKTIGDMYDNNTLPNPDGGDCWYCLMFDTAGTQVDHLISHIDDAYYFGSMVRNAFAYSGYRISPFNTKFSRGTARRCVYKFMADKIVGK